MLSHVCRQVSMEDSRTEQMHNTTVFLVFATLDYIQVLLSLHLGKSPCKYLPDACQSKGI